jgi:hypothetical protein
MATVTETNLGGEHADWTAALDGSNKEFTVDGSPDGRDWACHINGLFRASTFTAPGTFTFSDDVDAPEEGDEISISYSTSSVTTSDYQSILGIVNLALIKVGAKKISSVNDTGPNAVTIMAVWDYIRDEVLQARDWNFAKTRVALTINATAPLYGYDYAYDIPSNFLRLVRQKQGSGLILNPASNPPGGFRAGALAYPELYTQYTEGAQIHPSSYPWIIETLPSGTRVMCIDYLATADDPLYINYIARITDATKYDPMFISALACRLAAEIAISITEDQRKATAMLGMYQSWLRQADGVNASLDYFPDTGSSSWEKAGR